MNTARVNIKVICSNPNCKFKSFRVYKDEDGFGPCRSCGNPMKTAPKTDKHIVWRGKR